MKLLRHCVVGLLLTVTTLALADGYALRTVRSGDSIGAIANRYNLTVDALMQFNELESATIHPGQILRVPYVAAVGGTAEPAPPPPPGFRQHVLQSGETLSDVTNQYDVTLQALVGANPDLSSLDRLPAGMELLIAPSDGLVVTLESEGELGRLLDHYGVNAVDVARANDLTSPADITPGMLLFLPGVEPMEALERLSKVRELENTYLWPLQGRITSYFGRRNLGMGTSNFHRGIDVAAPFGSTITAARTGTVSFAGWSSQGYGYLIKVRHAGGAETWYGHNSKILVGVGEYVRQGEPIGLVGSTGISTGPHLHFELYERGRAIDPLGQLR
ncbi:MAG: LysM peptidoglycan-binding domain-containing M23 family metallopeptidase [Trueperaceae bacterium]